MQKIKGSRGRGRKRWRWRKERKGNGDEEKRGKERRRIEPWGPMRRWITLGPFSLCGPSTVRCLYWSWAYLFVRLAPWFFTVGVGELLKHGQPWLARLVFQALRLAVFSYFYRANLAASPPPIDYFPLHIFTRNSRFIGLSYESRFRS